MFLTHDFPSTPPIEPSSLLLEDLKTLHSHYSKPYSWISGRFAIFRKKLDYNTHCILGAIDVFVAKGNIESHEELNNSQRRIEQCPRALAVSKALAKVAKITHYGSDQNLLGRLMSWNDHSNNRRKILRTIEAAMATERKRLAKQKETQLCS